MSWQKEIPQQAGMYHTATRQGDLAGPRTVYKDVANVRAAGSDWAGWWWSEPIPEPPPPPLWDAAEAPPERARNELHIYGQLFYHGEAWICGNPAALHALRDTIDRALATDEPTSSHHLTRDGEGYATIVVPVSTTDTLQLPYSWSETMEDRVGTHPFETVSRERYRALMKESLR